MEWITRVTPVNRSIRVSINYEGEPIVELSSVMGSHIINLSGDKQDLIDVAKDFTLTGFLRDIASERNYENYYEKALKLGVVITQLELDPGKELILDAKIIVEPPKYSGEKETRGIFFKLSVDYVEDIPVLLPDLIDSTTEYINLFHHRLITSGVGLN